MPSVRDVLKGIASLMGGLFLWGGTLTILWQWVTGRVYVIPAETWGGIAIRLISYHFGLPLIGVALIKLGRGPLQWFERLLFVVLLLSMFASIALGRIEIRWH